jgi:HEAT repeat protein
VLIVPAGSLFSPDPAERRDAVRSLVGRQLSPLEVGVVGRLIASDPDPELRAMAVRALARAAGEVPVRIVLQGLRDPDDGVRAAMVHVAAERSPAAAPMVARLAVRRRWPQAQFAALERLPVLLDAVPELAEENLETLLSGVATMEPPPLEAERSSLAEVTRSIGMARLAIELDRPGPRRLGAVRLLLMEGSPSSLRKVAALTDDPIEEVRVSAEAAVNMLVADPGDEEAATDFSIALEAAPESEPTADDIVGTLASALDDPDEQVRLRCREALESLPEALLVDWIDRALASGSQRVAARAAAVAEALHLAPAAPGLVRRAATLPPEARGPYVGALDALRLDPELLADLVYGADPAHRQEALRLVWHVGGKYVLGRARDLAKDPIAAVRRTALEVLCEAADPAAIALCLQALDEDSSAAVRATAVRLLGRFGGAHRAEAMRRALDDPDPDVRATAVDSLPRQLSAGSAAILSKALHDEDEQVWRAALPHFAGLPDDRLPLVWEVIRNSSPAKREEIARALERADGERLVSLARANAAAPDWADRALAVDLAARAGGNGGVELVIEALEDPDPVVRRAAATALGGLRNPVAVPALARTVSDPQVDVRVEVIRALGLIDDDSVLAPLISALKDPAGRVRSMATEALRRWRSPGVARRLAAALRSPDLRGPAEALLEGMGRSAVEPLVEVILQGDRELARVAGALIDRITGPDPFLERLSSRRPSDRLQAVEVLGAIDGPTASEWLMASLADPDRAVRMRAVTLLGELGDPRALEPLKQVFLVDPVAEVSAVAGEALRRLGSMPKGDAQMAPSDPQVPDDLQPFDVMEDGPTPEA